MTKLMTREEILGAADIESVDVDLSDIPGWGIVRLQDLTGSARDEIEASLIDEQTKNGKTTRSMRLENVRATIVAAALVDENGGRMFSKRDVAALGEKSARALNRLFDIVRERNGLNQEDVEELVGNSDGSQGEDSPTN